MEKNADITVYFNTLQHIKEQITKNVVKKFLDSGFMKTAHYIMDFWTPLA